MTAKTIITLKFLLAWVYCFSISPLAKAVIEIQDKREPPEAIFWFFCIMMWLPEMATTMSKQFRNWIKEGIEDENGRLKDVKDIIIHYASLTSMKLFILESLLMMFYDVDIAFQFYMVPFFGSVGLSGFTTLKNMYKPVK